ncbi:MAG TPA: DUF4038 domain-containing protein, partial [Patescibacteria group bacterium]|nr:DUF4038 domain-containing protein [Patescibacteria group bacterium]
MNLTQDQRSERLMVLRLLVVMTLGLAPVLCEGVNLPLKLSASKRYLVDQNNTPVFIHGAAPWSLIAQINSTDAELYISNRVSLGVN